MPPLPRRASAAPPAAPPTVPLAPAAAPLTVPLESPVARPRSGVRTVPVITDDIADDTGRAALEVAVAAPNALGTGTGATAATPADEAGDGHTESAAQEPPTWEPPTRVVVLRATEGQQAARGNGSVWPGDSKPSDDDEPGADERGLWSRIGQALVRSTTRPLREPSGDDEAASDQRVP